MATILLSKSFEDIFGNVTTFYRANACDLISSTFVVENAISIKSKDTNYFTLDAADKTFTRISGEWEDDGFRTGQTVTISGPTFGSYSAVIDGIVDNVMYISNIGTISSNQTYNSTDFAEIVASDHHDCVDVMVNFVNAGGSATTGSLIDGENTILRFTGLSALSVGSDVSPIQVGHKSGQFDLTAELEYTSVSSGKRKYTITVHSKQGGAYFPDTFTGSQDLKLICQFNFQVVDGEPYGNAITQYNEEADTGWFDQAYNTGVVNSSIVDSITAIDYRQPTSATFQIDSAITDRQIGSLYVPLDANYYKNNNFTQSEHSMLLDSFVEYADDTYTSFVNSYGAGYTIDVSTVGTVGTVTTYQIVFTPNSEFTDFMDGRDNGDRRFILYFKCGTINIRVFDGQLTKKPLSVAPIPHVTVGAQFNDHYNNTTDILETIPPIFYTEDDAAFVLKFRPDKFSVYSGMRVIIEAFNTVTSETFSLETMFFDFSNVAMNADGIYLFNEAIGVGNNLPTTSAKKVARLDRYPSSDTVSTYGVKLYYPFLCHWEYWLSQPNADVSFAPNQNKNWQQYSSDPDWNTRIRVQLESDEQTFEYARVFDIKDYDSGNFVSSIDLFRENGDPAIVIVEGEIMTVVATHSALSPINPDEAWGWIKIQPKEGAPYWIDSSVIGNGGDTNNPLFNIILSTSGNNLILTCKFDTTKIDLSNGVTFSSRANGSDLFLNYWLTTDGDYFLQEGSINKWVIQ